MQKLSEYIPLIIIIGSIVFSMVSSLRKKMKEVIILQRETQKSDVNTTQDAISGRDMGNIMKTPAKKNTQGKWVQTASKHKSIDEEPASSSEFSFSDTEESDLLSFDISDGNEIRKMIIFSEIINRREY